MHSKSIHSRFATRQAVLFITFPFFFTQGAAAKYNSCDEMLALAPIQVSAFQVRIADFNLTAPEVIYTPSSQNHSDQDVVQIALGMQVSASSKTGKNRRVFAWTSPAGQSLVAKVYRRRVEPFIIAGKMQRELLVQDYLDQIGVRTAPVLEMLPEGIVLQRNVGMVVSEFVKDDRSRRARIQPHLSRFGGLFAKSPIREFESFLRRQYPNHGHNDVDRTLENIGITIADDNVELEMVDW